MGKINRKELSNLFVEIRRNSTVAFEELYRKYHKLVYSIAFSIVKNNQDAEDVVQIVFTKIYSMDKSKLPSKSEASWLYSITKNETINFLKKKNNHISLEEVYEIEDNNNEIVKIVDKESYNKLMEGLSDKEKEIISLKVLANLSFEEIAQILKMPTGTIKWRYYKSIYALKILLSNLGMFIVTAVIGIVTLKNPKKQKPVEKPEISNIEDESTKKENSIIQNQTKEDTDRVENTTLENSNSQTPENVIEVPVERDNTNYMAVTFIGISILFFIITIIFSIIFAKHQLKRRKRLSK